MKKLILMMIALAMGFLAAYAQTTPSKTKTERKFDQAQKKQLKEEMFGAQKEKLLQLANDRNLVLEATAIYGRHGFNATVTQNNFVLIDSTNFVLQTSSPNAIGQNGLGGITLRGIITSYSVKPGKDKAPIVITAQVNTFGLGGGTLIVRLNDQQNSSAIFTTNTGGTITLSGPVTSMEESSVYKGMNLY